jgi:hypothetical protein
MINEIEWIRKQIMDLASILEGTALADGITEAGSALGAKLEALEGRLFDLRQTGGTARQDRLWWPRRLYAKLTSLAGYIGKSDFPPTAQQREVREIYARQVAEAQDELRQIEEGDLAAFQELLAEKGIGAIVSGVW